MSGIADIRTGLAALLADLDSVNGSNGYPPDSVGALPYAFVGLQDVAVSYSAGLEENQFTLPVIVLVERTAGLLGANIKRLESIETELRAALLADEDLGNRVNLCLLQRVQQDIVSIGQTPYAGFIATLLVIDKYGVTFGGD